MRKRPYTEPLSEKPKENADANVPTDQALFRQEPTWRLQRFPECATEARLRDAVLCNMADPLFLKRTLKGA